MKFKTLFFGLFFLSIFSLQAQNEKFVKKAPSWVIEKSHIKPKNQEGSKSNGGEYPLLYDRQLNLDKKEFYFHWTSLLKNSESVSLYNTLEFSFDPTYQKLEIHFINIIRNGKVINKMSPSEFKIITKEENADRKLYDNNKTLISHLQDIRQGDILDYAYTIKGQNPAYGSHQYASQEFEFSYPLELFYFSVLSSSTKLKYKLLKDAKYPTILNNNGFKRYYWEEENLPAYYFEENTPSWFQNSPMVCFSDIEKWEDVAELSRDFYKVSEEELAYFKKQAMDICKSKDSMEMILDIIRFVQDDIRYLGFEDGLNAFIPHRPKAVFDQRFGDCKDKSLLLSTLLKSIGIKSSPVLVNSYLRENLIDRLASPFVFNHCVSSFFVYDQTYYIDPTMSNQGGECF